MDDWQNVFERHGSLVWATVYRILGNHAEALDCCQEVFAEMLARPSNAPPVHNWAGYLKWIATRRAIDELRRRRSHATRFEPNGDVTLATANSCEPGAEILADELRRQLKDEMARLPPQQAQAFWLVSVEELSYEEAGAHLGIEPNYVGVLVHRARGRLRKWLAEMNPAAQRDSSTT